MADEKDGKGGELGPFRLGRRYKEVSPDLGRLHEAWHSRTGRVAWVLQPGTAVEWQFAGPWQLRLGFQPQPPAMTLEVEQAPSDAQMVEMADMLVTMTAAVEQMEDNPRAQAHLARGVVAPRTSWAPRAIAGLAAVGLGVGCWLLFAAEPVLPPPPSPEVATERPSQVDAPERVHTAGAEEKSVAYPLPYEPFRNQAKAPCRVDLAEIEINGGCWVSLEQRPPCAKNRAEHQGKCYLPVSKDRGAPPQSAKP